MRTSIIQISLSCLYFIGFSLSPLIAQQRVQLVNNPTTTPDIIEKSPVVSWDGNTMVYLSNKGGKWELYTAQKSPEGLWQNAQALSKINNYSESNGTIHSPSFNYDGSRMYFAANFDNDGGGMNIYYTDKIGGEWQDPIKLDQPINSENYEGSPSITPDERTLYFVRTNPLADNKDYACKAIYVAYKNSKGRWSEPELLPQPINLECEECPSIAADGKVLFFSSVRKYKDKEGRESKDGYDLYYAKRIGATTWIKPILLDSLSTDGDDMSPSMAAFGETLYYHSGDEKKKNIKKRYGSVFEGNLPKASLPLKTLHLTGKVTDLMTKQPVRATLKLTNPYTAEVLANYKNDPQSGEYEFFLTAGKSYQLDVYQAGYSHKILHFDLKNLAKHKALEQPVEIYSDVTLVLNVFDHELYESLVSKIEVLNAETGEKAKKATVKTLQTGRYQLTLPIGKRYQFKVSSVNYQPIEYEFDMREVVQFSEYEKDLALKIKKKKIAIQLIDAETKVGIPLDINVKNLNRRESIDILPNDEVGNYQISFRSGDQYEMKFYPKGYAYKDLTLKIGEDTPDSLVVELNPIKEEKTIVLNHITFEVNSADLEEASFAELDRVFNFMMENRAISIELSAHTDDRGEDAYNLLLSEKRAESVKRYLIDKGLTEDRLKSKGYGEQVPLVENTSEENRAKNRRVEMKVIKVEEAKE